MDRARSLSRTTSAIGIVITPIMSRGARIVIAMNHLLRTRARYSRRMIAISLFTGPGDEDVVERWLAHLEVGDDGAGRHSRLQQLLWLDALL